MSDPGPEVPHRRPGATTICRILQDLAMQADLYRQPKKIMLPACCMFKMAEAIEADLGARICDPVDKVRGFMFAGIEFLPAPEPPRDVPICVYGA